MGEIFMCMKIFQRTQDLFFYFLEYSMSIRNALVLLLSTLIFGQAQAQTYPARPIKMIVAYPAGGGTDVVARMVAKRLGDLTGQPVTVENRAGGMGTIGAREVARAPADGYTLLFTAVSELTVSHKLVKGAGYTAADFTPVIRVAETPFVIMSNPSVSVTDFADLRKLAQQRPNTLSLSVPAPYSFLTASLLLHESGLAMNIIQYKGSAQSMTDLIGGHVQTGLDTLTASLSMIKSNKVRPLAVASVKRSAFLPDVKTTSEYGLPNVIGGAPYAVVAPKDIPADVLRTLHTHITTIAANKTFMDELMARGIEPVVGDTPAAFKKSLDADAVKWGGIADKVGLKPE